MRTVKTITWPGVLGLLALAALLFPAYGAEKTTYFHWDAQGSPIAATDETGNVIWREEYRPFGARIRQEPAAASNTRWYTGHPHDDATGLTYMGARYYDPVVGRFMAIDPKGFGEGNIHSFNRYAYANNNPYKFVDPDGNVAIIPAIVWVAKAIGEGIADVGLDMAIAEATGQEFSLGDALKSFGIGTGAALVGAGAVVKARKAAKLAELAKGPIAGGGAKVENLNEAERRVIQRFADKNNVRITVVGSRAAKPGGNGPNSDFDFLIDPINSKIKRSAKRQLPGGGRRRNRPARSYWS